MCNIEGCIAKIIAKGLCYKHYMRKRRYGRTDLIRAENGTGRPVSTGGYINITVNGERIGEHVHLAEKALGRKLPPGAQVHHMNEKPWDNHTPFNLVICPDQSYHQLLHKRTRILRVRS